MSIWVCGEVLIDLLPGTPDRVAVVGGGPANTAKALSRLGHQVQFIDGFSTDNYGKSARAELLNDGVGLELALTSDLPTCTATISLSADGSASYEFLIDNRNLEVSETILRFALSKLSKDELQEVFTEINKTLI